MFKTAEGVSFSVISESADKPSQKTRPSDIDLSDGLSETFGKCEVEEAAVALVRFFQEKGRWTQFTFEELLAFYKTKGLDPEYMLFGLLGSWIDYTGLFYFTESLPFLVRLPDGAICATSLFVKRCEKHKLKRQ